METENKNIKENMDVDNYAVSLGLSVSELKACEEKILVEINSAKYLDPRFDPGFKKLLGTKDALRSFLNGVLAPMEIESIEKLHFENVEVNIYTPEHLQLRMDIRAKTCDGRHINVEMQKASLTFIRERILLQESAFVCVAKKEYDLKIKEMYPSDSIEDCAAREKFRYDIPHTYAIWICDFCINSASGDNYHDSWHVYSDSEIQKGGALPVSEKIKYILIDLGKFNKCFEELENDEDRWLYLLKNAGIAKEEFPKFNNPAIDDAVARIRISEVDDETREAQMACTMSEEEKIGRLALAYVDGREEGREEGREQGREEGREERKRLEAEIRKLKALLSKKGEGSALA